ncbi:hypothetical protein NEIRO03_1639 [Nematocida sp. AWRm78]|nr:hypothetical protein NEIRO02_2276 [Nematocida sp. AWRm79]KAI5184183.1 hypothetical protein NEIRO03_1639 [Nematocida sp. AWRm78]
MEYFVILTNKGPAVFQKTSQIHGRVLFAGTEYAVPIENVPVTKDEDKHDAFTQSIIWSAIQVIQIQRFGKCPSKKRKLVQVIKKDERTGDGKLTSKNKSGVIGLLLGTGIAKMFKTSFGLQKSSTNTNEYPEGEFSSFPEINKREKPIEPLIAFEATDKGEMFQCKFSIVMSDETSGLLENTQIVYKSAADGMFDKSSSILKEGQKSFYAGELSFIMGLQRSKVCIKEVGNWLYNSDHNKIFTNLQAIIRLLSDVFLGTIIRTMSKDYIDVDVNACIEGNAADLTALYGDTKVRLDAFQKLQQLIDKKLVNAAMETVSISMLAYFDKLSSVIYSPTFITYIASVEENIAMYKQKYSSEVMAAERKFNCNLCLLFVDIYHRLIKYRLYITEAMNSLEKGYAEIEKKAALKAAETNKNAEEASSAVEADPEALLFKKEILLLSKHNDRLTELLKATERFKKIKSLAASGIVFPDCVDDFIEMYELTNGMVIITKENLVVVNGKIVIAVISKKEVLGCIPASQDTEYPTIYIDLAVSSLYPPVPNFVTDIVNDVRVHWIRLNFKWDGNQKRFVDACKCRNVSTIKGLEMLLQEKVVPVNRSLREKLAKSDVKNSHRRMLAIRAQRDFVSTSDVYAYGQKNRMSEPMLFGIKAWIDAALNEYSVSLSSISVTNCKAVSFDKKLRKEVVNILKYHSFKASSNILDKNEFSSVMTDEYSLAQGIPAFIGYLSYIYRLLSPPDMMKYSEIGMKALHSVHDIRNTEITNDEFLHLAIGFIGSMPVPESLNRNEFLLSLVIVRFFIIAAPDIGMDNYLAICAPLFLFNSEQLISLPQYMGR